MAGKRVKQHHPFIQFLMENYREPDGTRRPLGTLIELADVTGRSKQVMSKYNEHGLDDIGKRIELTLLCNIHIQLLVKFISAEIPQRSV